MQDKATVGLNRPAHHHRLRLQRMGIETEVDAAKEIREGHVRGPIEHQTHCAFGAVIGHEHHGATKMGIEQ